MSRVRELPRFSVPGSCIMFPGRRRDERGFYLFDQVLQGAQGDIIVGISGEGLRTIAQRHGEQFGLALREELTEAKDEAVRLRARVAELEAENLDLLERQERIAGLARDGFEIKRRQGRPPTKKED